MPIRRRPESPEARRVRNALIGPNGRQVEPHIYRVAHIGDAMEVLFTVPVGPTRIAKTAVLWSDGTLTIQQGWGA